MNINPQESPASILKPCTMEGCDRPHYSRSWCRRHYDRWRRHGQPNAGRSHRSRPVRICIVDGCVNPHAALQLCHSHYTRQRKHGDIGSDPLKPRYHDLPVSERFDNYTEATGTGCILWKGSRSGDGYGQFYVDGRRVMAHRWAYERAYGSIHPDAEIDHVECPDVACCNPSHLQAVTPFLNRRLIQIRAGKGEDWERQAVLVQGLRIHPSDPAPASTKAQAGVAA